MPSLPINRPAARRDPTADPISCWIDVPSADGTKSAHIINSSNLCKQYSLVNHDFCSLDPNFKAHFRHICPPSPPTLLGADHHPTTPGSHRYVVEPVRQQQQQSAEQYGALALIFAGGFLSVIVFAIIMHRCNRGARYVYEPGYYD
ncbi:hypothetical protein F5Y00DRAFT_261268 [Daldinia vernicosa]|uniref:uncharacterized protein n=1 Tax=Daldinia vernicosa TaxID=114800 RepID=UPI002008D717|nr:uncharacterized protein F5Y00DRAFT_261268 [Daldinia vernicosa]KAI0849822.1 hypothetical protein F5Y00DRAFT_261268 [Daldinia vernicosa]